LREQPMKRVVFALAIFGMTIGAAALPSARVPYPTALRDKTVDTYFGIKVPAPYQWMENLSGPRLHKWVNAENALTDDYLSKIPIRGRIDHRLTELWNYAKEDAPKQLKNGMLFFSRNSGLQNQSAIYVQTTPGAHPRALLDPNRLSKDGSIALTEYEPSPDGRYLAYALSTGGSDWEIIHIMEIATARELPDRVRWVKFSGISWTQDERGFFYSRFAQPPDNAKVIGQAIVNQKVYFHRLGTPQSDDKLIYGKPDLPHAYVTVGFVQRGFCDNGRYLFFSIDNGWSANELYYADLRNSRNPDLAARIKPLYAKDDAAYRPIGCIGGTLYLRTTLNAPRGRIVATSFSDPDPAHWRVVVPQQEPGAVLADSALADGRILASYEVLAKSRVELFSTAGKALDILKLPALGTVSEISARNSSRIAYYAFTSYLFPTTIYKLDAAEGAASVYFKPDVKFDPSGYETKQVLYTSKEGTRVPMFIVARKGIKLDGSHPTVLYGYGGFNLTVTPDFDPTIPAWLELGGVYAVANIRGGGVYGQAWHQAGMLGNKQNAFDDFAWAAKYLIKEGYTSPKRLGIQGFSNGGLLTGVSITQRPGLFGAAYIGHGVLDMLRYQKFSGGAYWVPEYGSSDNERAFHWLVGYSPLQNVRKDTCYPPTYITASWDDDRVVPSHEFEFTAEIQRAQRCGNPILLRTTGSTSHMYMPTGKLIQQDADVWAFEAYNLGIG
jgi:prolyl oligopeptidase